MFRELEKTGRSRLNLNTICTYYGYNFTLPRVSFLALSALSPLLFCSLLFSYSYSFPPVILSPFFLLFTCFIFFFFRPLIRFYNISFRNENERRMESIEADIGGSYISLVEPDQLLLFVVFYLRCTLWSISGDVGMTRLLGQYPCSIPCVIFFYSALVLVSRMDGKEE